MVEEEKIIELVAHPYPEETWLARHDHAIVTGQEIFERPWWYVNRLTGQEYHDIVGCIGWPGEVTARGEGLPGYLGVIGVIKNSLPAEDAVFQILDEYESRDVSALLTKWVEMRRKWGTRNILKVLFGDPEKHLTTRAIFSETVEEVLVVAPVDFYDPNAFDIYVRVLRTALDPGSVRLYVGKNVVFRNRVRMFERNDPAIFAVGGAVHTLIASQMWMERVKENVFAVEEGFP